MGAALLTDAELKVVVHELATRFESSRWLEGTVFSGAFQSHTSTFYELTDPGVGEPGALVKVGRDWDAAEAKRIHEDLVTLAALLAPLRPLLGVGEPLGWHPSPPAIGIRYVPGEDLGHLLRTGDTETLYSYESVVRGCGEALGLFHANSEIPPLEDASGTRKKVETMARAVRVRPWFLDELDLEAATARRYGDYAPYNFRIDGSARAWLIDHPSPPQADLVHRDAAWFLFNLERRLGWETGTRRASLGGVRSALVAAFHDGYARSGPVPLDMPPDRALLALYRAHRSLWTARRRMRQREWREVPAYLKLARAWRRRASPPG